MHANASVDEIAVFLDGLLDVPKYAAVEPDSNGLLVRAADPGISKFAVAVNTTLTTIVGAAKTGAQLLIVHHPPWRAVDLHLYEERVEMLRTAGISLYAAHAALDCAPEVGVAASLAKVLGVTASETFCEFAGGHAGVIGGASAGSLADFARHASQALGAQVEWHEHGKAFGRVALVGGAGGNTTDLDDARKRGADTYVTGEGSMFTRMFARETGMNLVFGTHHATEAPGVRALGERLALEAQVPWEFIADSPDVF